MRKPALLLLHSPASLNWFSGTFVSARGVRPERVAPRYPIWTKSLHRHGMSSYSGGGRGGRGRGGGGRGAYYKNKYGGGGRNSGDARDRGPLGGNGNLGDNHRARTSTNGGTFQDLKQLLQHIDGRQYPAYHDLETAPNTGWVHPEGFVLQVGRAQADPFAPPTRCRVTLPPSVSRISNSFYTNATRRMATGDFLLRRLYGNCKRVGADHSLRSSSGGKGGWSGPKGGDVQVLEPTQNVIEQSAVQVDEQGNILCQITINLPAKGRSIMGHAAHEIMDAVLPQLISDSLMFTSMNLDSIRTHIESVEDQAWLQQQLDTAGLVSFVRNGAILPRVSGVEDRPMAGSVVAFKSPPSLQKEFTLPISGVVVQGMGIRKGVTLICGGGFHGKSTLLQAIQSGVYLKVPGDGREFCVTSSQAVKIRAEDGRAVQAVDISPFINNLPFGKGTSCFTTSDASGSTSQATNIVESIELGADTLLVDEDTCATNFMVRDNKMMELVASDKEPITPFVRVIRSLYESQGVSSVLVIGGLGDYFDVADHVLLMDSYGCQDVTAHAKEIVARSGSDSAKLQVKFGKIRQRFPVLDTFAANGKVRTPARGVISYGDVEIDLTSLEQIVSISQTSAIGAVLQCLSRTLTKGKTIRQALQDFDSTLDTSGLEILAPGQFHGGLTRARLFELGAAVNRFRKEGSIKQDECSR